MIWFREIQTGLGLLVMIAIQMLAFPAHAAELNWIDEGWNQLEQKHQNKAIDAWQRGVDSIADDYLLIQLGVYMRRSEALDMLKRAGRQEQAIVLRAPFKGRTGYYVLSPRTVASNAVIRHQQLASLREAIGATEYLYGNGAHKFKHGKSKSLSEVVSFGQVKEGPGILDAAPRSFTMRSFILHDNTLISDEAIQAQIKPFLGPGKTRKDMVAAGKAINKLYRSRGYRLSAIKMPVEVRDSEIPVFIVESPQSRHAAAAEKAAAEQAVAEKAAAEQAVAEKAAVEQAATEKAAVEQAVAEKAAVEQAAAEKAAAEQAAAEKETAEQAATEKTAAEQAAAERARHWTLNGARSLKENLMDLARRNQWSLKWEVPNDYQVGVNVDLVGSIDEIVAQIVNAYAMRNVLLKVTWFNGNKVLLVQRVYSRNDLVEASK